MQQRLLVLLGVLLSGFTLPAEANAQHATVGGVALRVLSHQALVRGMLGDLLPPERRVSQTGIELTIPTPWTALRAEGRLLRSDRGNSDLGSIDAGLVLGWRALGVAAAYGQRRSYDPVSGLAHSRDAEFGRLGLRLRLGAPDAHFLFHLRGDGYLPVQSASDSVEALRGWDAEGGVTLRTRSLPFTASLGYRLERFRIFGVEQEVSALTFALGVALGER